MQHLDDGVLRRLYDEPLATPAGARQHYASCSRCQARFRTIAADAHTASMLLSPPGTPVDMPSALAAVRARIAAEHGVHTAPRLRHFSRGTLTMPQPYRRRFIRPFVGVAAAAALLGALLLTPAGSFAQNLLTIFTPQQFAAVPVTPGELQSLPDLSNYGVMTGPTNVATQNVTSAAAAATASGLTVRVPASLPDGVPATAAYAVIPRTTASFTFSAARARAAAAATGKPLPPMPDDIDGSTLNVTVGPAVVTVYGDTTALSSGADVVRHGSRGVRGVIRRSVNVSSDELPALIVAQMAVPSVTSTRASRAEIEDYLLDQPGVSPQLAVQIRAIGNPDTTLPIPVPVSLATAQTVTVQGVQGLAIGDNTGVGSAVIWQKDGEVYGVAGTLPEDQIMAIANGLH